MIFSKIFFSVWLARKNYKMQKSEFGKCHQNPATTTGFRRNSLIRFRQETFGYGRNLPDPTQSMARSDHIRPFWPDPAGLAEIRQYSGAGRIPATGCCRTPARLDSDDRQLLNSDNRISNVRVRTKSLILKNDLLF
jgi:hypothetical protein